MNKSESSHEKQKVFKDSSVRLELVCNFRWRNAVSLYVEGKFWCGAVSCY